jgi:hypothetical protein
MISNVTRIKGAVQTLSGTTPNASALIARQGYDSLTVYLETVTVTDAGAAAGFTTVIQHSDTTVAGDFVDVPADGLIADSDGDTTITVTTDGANGVVAGGVGYVGGKRYVRTLTTGTSGTNATVTTNAMLGKPHRAPVATIGATTAAT